MTLVQLSYFVLRVLRNSAGTAGLPFGSARASGGTEGPAPSPTEKLPPPLGGCAGMPSTCPSYAYSGVCWNGRIRREQP